MKTHQTKLRGLVAILAVMLCSAFCGCTPEDNARAAKAVPQTIEPGGPRFSSEYVGDQGASSLFILTDAKTKRQYLFVKGGYGYGSGIALMPESK